MAASLTSHHSYRCMTCQADLDFGPLACVDKADFIFNEAREPSVKQQPVGVLRAILPSKRRVSCGNCEAKLGHAGRGLSFLDRKRFCFKIRSSALDVIVGNPKEALDRTEENAAAQEARKEAAPPSAAAQEAGKKEITAFRRAVMEKIERRRRIAALLRAILI